MSTMNTTSKSAMSDQSPLQTALAPLRALWSSRGPRERQMLSLLAVFLMATLLWVMAIAPALKTLASAPAQLALLNGQLAVMQNQARETNELRAIPPLQPGQASAALKAAVDRLGDKAKLVLQGDRAVITLTQVGQQALRDCLSEARTTARARPLEATLSKTPQGFSGNVVLSLGASL